MYEVFIKYNPYKLETEIRINGNLIPKDSEFYPLTAGIRMQEWIVDFPEKLSRVYNTRDFKVTFKGMALDYDDVREAFSDAVSENILNSVNMNWEETRDNEEIKKEVKRIFYDLYNGPVLELKDSYLKDKFESVNEETFPVNVVATMSSGKSTLINALLGHKLMPARNEACTATITEITDNDADYFEGEAFDKSGKSLSERFSPLTYENMDMLNSNEEVFKIKIDGDIPFIDAKTDVLRLSDTPGPNNSRNQAHKDTTYKTLNSDSNNLIIYVLNASQLGINDDASLLDYVAEQMRKGSKEIRDRFLFVINKMDTLNPEEESIEGAIKRAKNYLSEHGINNPQIFPCSAYVALNIRTHLKDIDVETLSRAEIKKLPLAAQNTITAMDGLNEYEEMHLEKYTTLSPSAQSEIEVRLQIAEENGDEKEQALIHSGIVSIEAAITAYVKKYAKTRKVRDLVETFQSTLNASEVFARLKSSIADDSNVAEAFAKKAKMIEEKIQKGEDAEKFKKSIEAFDPMPSIRKSVDKILDEARTKTSLVFEACGDTIDSRAAAKMIIKQFTTVASDQMAALGANIESIVNKDVIATGEKMLNEYRAKLEDIDEKVSVENVDFKTSDLIQGELKKMRDSIQHWKKDEFSDITIKENADVKYETKKYYEKVGQEEEIRIVGHHQEKIGTKRVKVGTHEEVDHYEDASTWWNPFTWGDEKAVYKTVTDYRDEDVYKMVEEYETVMRDVFEERVERIEKFSMKTKSLSSKLLAPYMKSVNEGVEHSVLLADNQIKEMKKSFIRTFDKLDGVIASKYNELIDCTNALDEKKKEIEENNKTLKWLEMNKRELDNVLEL